MIVLTAGHLHMKLVVCHPRQNNTKPVAIIIMISQNRHDYFLALEIRWEFSTVTLFISSSACCAQR